MSDDSELLQPGVLPGDYTLDRALVDRAVADLNALYTEKAMETAVAIGTYVLDNFFEGDIWAFAQRRRAHLSFRELSSHPDLQLDHVYLYRAVKLVEQLTALPEGVTQHLSYSHHVELLPLRRVDSKARLARRAIERGWTVRQLRTEVRAARKREVGGRTGRPPLPSWHRGFKKVFQGIDEALSEPVEADVFGSSEPDRARALLDELDDKLARLGAYRDELAKALEDADGSG